jgi:TatD DNase family protein
VKTHINIHTHKSDERSHVLSIRNIDFSEHEFLKLRGYFSYGAHPWFINNTTLDTLKNAKETIQNNTSILCIGECGLDRNIAVDFQLQQEVFSTQIRIANELQLPLMIHSVRAFYDVVSELKKAKNKMPVIYHGYNNSFKIAQTLMENNGYLSFGKSILQPKNNTAEIFNLLPIERVFLENDESDLMIEDIYKKAAEIKSISEETLQQQLQRNFIHIFKNGQILA